MTEQSSTTTQHQTRYRLSSPSSSSSAYVVSSPSTGSGQLSQPTSSSAPRSETLAPGTQATTGEMSPVFRPRTSPEIHRVEGYLYVGLLRELPPPHSIKQEWETGIKEELDDYLCSIVRNSGLPDRKCTLESVLCLSGSFSPVRSMGTLWSSLPPELEVLLNPTVWIHCASRRCKFMIKRKIEEDVDALRGLRHFLENNHMCKPYVSRNAPWPAGSTPDPETSVTGSKIEGHFEMRFSIEKTESIRLRKTPIATAKFAIRDKSGTEVELFSTIGGMIRVGDKIFGLTTAHAVVDHVTGDTLQDDESSSEDDTSVVSEPEGAMNLDVEVKTGALSGENEPKGDRLRLSKQGCSDYPARLRRGSEWIGMESPTVLAYQGRGTTSGDLAFSDHAPETSDFALVDLTALGKLSNTYDGPNETVFLANFIPIAELEEGEVSILTPQHQKPMNGYLVDGPSNIIVRGRIMHTRKIQIDFSAYHGISGSWVVRGDKLCGIVYAAYDQSPYLHLLAAETVFKTISDFLDKAHVTVARDEDLKKLGMETSGKASHPADSDKMHTLVPRKNYAYRPLDQSRHEIRIIKLHPAASESSPVRCEIVHISLDSSYRLDYEAISYVWGNTRKIRDILCVHDDGEDEVVKVTASCIFALQRIRHDERIRNIWIDAVCIDQANNQERGNQVGMMGNIYSGASRVVIIPSDVYRPYKEFLMVRSVNNRRESRGLSDDQLIPEPPEPPEEPSMFGIQIDELGAVNWFQRTWVLQETLLAKTAVLALREASIPFREFIDVSQYTGRMGLRIHDLRLHKKLHSSPHMTLLQLLWVTRMTEATEARDKIFALLGIASDGAEYKSLVNYDDKISTADIFTRCAREIICRSGRLDILSAVYECGKPVEDIPSWVPDWRIFDPRHRTIVDPFRPSLPQDHLGCGSVSVPTLPSAADPKILRLRGTALGNIIRKKTARSDSEDMLIRVRDFQEEALSHMSDKDAARLLVDIFTCGYVEQPTETLTTEQKECVDEGRKFFKAAVDNEYWYAGPMAPRLYRYLHKRSLIETSDGHFGLAPVTVIKGDVICVLEGGSVPYVMRRKRCDAEEYQLIGECYVSGAIYREVMNGLEEKDRKIFDIGCVEESLEDEVMDFNP